jgi:putative ABC transport system substrate-binding protein
MYTPQITQGIRIATELRNKLRILSPLFALLCLLNLIVIDTLLASTDQEILVIKSGTDDIYSQVAGSFSYNLQQHCSEIDNRCGLFNLNITSVNESNALQLEQQVATAKTLIVTIGSRAAKFVATHHHNSPVLHTLVPKQTFSQLVKASNTSAIYIDQPIFRQLRLIRESMPERRRVGILINDHSYQTKLEVQKLSKKYGLKPQFGVVSNAQKIGNVLSELMEKSDVLLALPDPMIFNRHTVRNILLSSYHQQIPVIGFSEAYVNAGAIAAAFSSPQDIGRHMGSLVGSFLAAGGKKLPRPAYPKYYSIKCNKRVANSLQIHLPPADQLNHSPGE